MMEIMEALTEVMKPPLEVLQAAVASRWTFGMHHFPREQDSDDEPPTKLREPTEVILIDHFLGTYEPETLQITIFQKAVEQVAAALKVRAADVKFVVRLHEWGHALLHLGLTRDERDRIIQDEALWPNHLATATEWALDLDPSLHERLVQLLVHHGLTWLRNKASLAPSRTAIERITTTFDQLTRRAPSEYHINKFVDVPSPRLLASIELLKARALIGSSAWETVVTW